MKCTNVLVKCLVKNIDSTESWLYSTTFHFSWLKVSNRTFGLCDYCFSNAIEVEWMICKKSCITLLTRKILLARVIVITLWIRRLFEVAPRRPFWSVLAATSARLPATQLCRRACRRVGPPAHRRVGPPARDRVSPLAPSSSTSS